MKPCSLSTEKKVGLYFNQNKLLKNDILAKKPKKTVMDTIKFKLQAKLDEVSVKFANQNIDISLMAIKGLVADVIIKQAYTEVNARLINIAVVDLNKENTHNKVREHNIFSIEY